MRAEILSSPELLEHFVRLNNDDIPYARLHSDDARVEEIRQQMLQRRAALGRDGEDYCIGPSALDDIDYLLSLLPQLSSSENAEQFTHSEDYCRQCGRRNVVWFAPSLLWNKAVREHGLSEMLCPQCFIEAAEHAGIKPTAWEIAPEDWYEEQTQKSILAAIGVINAAIDATAPAESSERRCGRCGHEKRWCFDAGFESCGCKCVFPATGAGEGERREVIEAARAWRFSRRSEIGTRCRRTDGWVTFGRVKVDSENETETFERIHPSAPTTAPVVEAPCGICKFHWNQTVMPGERHNRNCPHYDDAEKGCACEKCGKRFQVDINVPDDLWARISDGYNLLCGPCITAAIEMISSFDYYDLRHETPSTVTASEAAAKCAGEIASCLGEMLLVPTGEAPEFWVPTIERIISRHFPPTESTLPARDLDWALRELADGWIQNNEREGPYGFYQNARRVLESVIADAREEGTTGT